MSCPNCFEVTLKQCPATIELTAGLSPATEYYWVLQRNNRVWQRKATTDGTGKLVIDCSVLPSGLLNAYAGSFTLEIREGANYLNIVSLNTYPCILMQFADVEGDAVNNLINVIAA